MYDLTRIQDPLCRPAVQLTIVSEVTCHGGLAFGGGRCLRSSTKPQTTVAAHLSYRAHIHRIPSQTTSDLCDFGQPVSRLSRDWASRIMKTDITWLDAKHIPSLESMKESGERALQSLLKSEKLAEIKAFLASNSVKPLHRVSLILAFLPVVAVSPSCPPFPPQAFFT